MLLVFIIIFLINIVIILCVFHSTMATASPLLGQSALPLSSESPPLSHQLLLLGVNSSQCCQVSLRLLRKILRCTGKLGCLLANLRQRSSLHFQSWAALAGRDMALRTPWNLSLPNWHSLPTIPHRSLGNPPPTAQTQNAGKFNS